MTIPCIGVCRFDRGRFWCVACGRTLAGCRGWKKALRLAPMATRRALPTRLNELEARGLWVIGEA